MKDAQHRGELDLGDLRAHDRSGLLSQIDRAVVYDVALTVPFRGITRRDGVLLHGPAGWGEVAPFWDYDARTSAPWLASALEAAVTGYADLPRHREQIPVNVTIPAIDPRDAFTMAEASGASTAKVKVALASPQAAVAQRAAVQGHASAPGTGAHAASAASSSASPVQAGQTRMARRRTQRQFTEDLLRLEAVREALGPTGKIRIDVNAAWDLETATQLIPLMDQAAQGLEYVEQPCASVADLAELRRRVNVPIAADESLRLAADPLEVVRQQAADLAVIKVAPLGGVRRALRLVEELGIDAVVSSALDTSVGLGCGTLLAGALPQLPYACGLGTATLLTRDVAVPAVRPQDGHVPVRAAHVSRALLTSAAAGPDVTARWQLRMRHLIGALADRREREARHPGTAQAGLPL